MDVHLSIPNLSFLQELLYDRIYPEMILANGGCVGTRIGRDPLPWRRPGYHFYGAPNEEYPSQLLAYKQWLTDNYRARLDEIVKFS